MTVNSGLNVSGDFDASQFTLNTATANVDVQSGKLTTGAAVAAPTVTIASGADLETAGDAGDGAINTNQLTLNGTLTRSGAGVSRDVTVANQLDLGSALSMTGGGTLDVDTAAVNVQSTGSLTLDSQSLQAASLNVEGVVNTAGLDVDDVVVESTGQLTSSADMNVQRIDVFGGAVDTGSGELVVGEYARLNAQRFRAETGDSFRVQGSNLGNDAVARTVTLDGGKLYIDASPEYAADPVAYYAFEDAGDLGLNSASGGLYSGTSYGDTTQAGGLIGNAVYLDGDGDYIVSDTVAAPLDGKSMTGAAWVKTNRGSALQEFALSFNQEDGGNRTMAGKKDNSSVYTLYADSNFRNTTGVVNDNEWHHIAWTTDGTDLILYFDGQAAATVAIDARVSATDLFSIGQEYDAGATTEDPPVPGDFWLGSVDEAFLYDYVLTADQINDLYEAGLDGRYGGGIDLSETSFQIAGASTLELTTTRGSQLRPARSRGRRQPDDCGNGQFRQLPRSGRRGKPSTGISPFRKSLPPATAPARCWSAIH